MREGGGEKKKKSSQRTRWRGSEILWDMQRGGCQRWLCRNGSRGAVMRLLGTGGRSYQGIELGGGGCRQRDARQEEHMTTWDRGGYHALLGVAL